MKKADSVSVVAAKSAWDDVTGLNVTSANIRAEKTSDVQY